VTLLFNGSASVPAAPDDVWPCLVDWISQERWIPMTTMRVLRDRAAGLGTRIRAEHGLRLGARRIGIADEMVVTGWDPPYELEMIHLGPSFTGVGVFTIEARGRRSWLSLRERVQLPGGQLAERAALAIRPLLQRQLVGSLQRFARMVTERTTPPTDFVDPARRHHTLHIPAAVFADEAEKRQRRVVRREERRGRQSERREERRGAWS
jgi:hypothetical protein